DPRPPQGRLLLVRRQVRRSGRRELEDPGRPAAGDDRARADAGGGDVSRARAGRYGARRFFCDARSARALCQRGEHHPRVHRGLDVPEDVGGLGVTPEGAREPIDRSRDPAAGRASRAEDDALSGYRGGKTHGRLRTPCVEISVYPNSVPFVDRAWTKTKTLGNEEWAALPRRSPSRRSSSTSC